MSRKIRLLILISTMTVVSMPMGAQPMHQKVEAIKDAIVYTMPSQVQEIIGATVVAINEETNQVTVLPQGKEDTLMNYIVLNVSEATKISEAIEVGDIVNVKHSPIMTFSIPPQTPALEITVVNEPVVPQPVTIEKATIQNVDLDSNRITIIPCSDKESHTNELVLNVSNDTTVVRHEFNKRKYRLEDLEEGMQVAVKHSPAVTASIPPQTTAFEIIILQDQTPNQGGCGTKETLD